MAGPEVLGALDDESGGGSSAESAEAFRERHQKTQAQVRAIKKAEDQARQKDDQLAAILLQLLHGQQDSRLLLLLARCLDRGIPAGFLLGILALAQKEAAAEFQQLLAGHHLALPAAAAPPTSLAQLSDAAAPSPDLLTALELWAHGLLQFGLTQPQRLLATAASPTGELFGSLLQLATFTVQDFLAGRGAAAEYELWHAFTSDLLTKVLRDVSATQQETARLGASA